MPSRLGIDVGGTFTDLLLFNESSGELQLLKTPSTPADQSQGIVHGTSVTCPKEPSRCRQNTRARIGPTWE